MRSASRRQRQRLLGEAFELGIRHFDVARMYGLGAAEGEVGRFAQRRRDRIAIATKFGIEPSVPAGRLAALQGPARAAIARFPELRTRLKRRDGSFHQPRRYDIATALASLETSLRALGTDYVDILFVHDPRPGDRVDMDELGEALESQRRAGRIRAWGVSGEPQPCIGLCESAMAPTVLQVRDDIFESGARRIEHETPPIAFGIFSRAAGRIRDHLAASEERRKSWSEAVGEDCADPRVLASLLLRDALDRNRDGIVLFSTTRVERMKVATATAATRSRGGPSRSLRAFRERVQAELGAGGGARG